MTPHLRVPTKKPFHFILKHIDGEMAHFLRNPSTKNVPGLALLSSKTDTTVLHIHTRKRGEAFASSEREEALISKPLFHAERPKFYCRLVDVKKLSREELFSRLPEEVKVEVLQSDFRGGYVSRMLSAKSPFLTLGGLQAGEKPFSLPLGSTVRLGFAVAEGWAEIEGEVVGWSANSNGSQMMVSCRPVGEVFQRRQKSRLPGEVVVVCSLQGVVEQSGETRNLSNSGMCVSLPFPLPKNRDVGFRLLPKGTPPVEMRGEVAWQTYMGDATAVCLAGVTARPVSELQRQRFEGLLDRLRRKTISEEGDRD